AEEYEPPFLGIRAVAKLDRGERYLHDHLVTVGGTRGGAAPYRIPGRVFVVLLADSVILGAACATEHLVGPLRVVEGAQEDADVIVEVAHDAVMHAVVEPDVGGMRVLGLEPQP